MDGELNHCRWAQDDEEGYWQTSCGRYYEINEGTPAENGMKFCTYCGNPLVGVGWGAEDDAA